MTFFSNLLGHFYGAYIRGIHKNFWHGKPTFLGVIIAYGVSVYSDGLCSVVSVAKFDLAYF